MQRRTFITASAKLGAVLLAGRATGTPRDGLPAAHTGIAAPALPPGGGIGVIAPASPNVDAAFEAIAWIESRGYRPRIFPGSFEESGYLAGDDETRLRDLHAAFADPSVQAIICLRGGYGTPRLLDRIDYPLISRHPKPFVGYSDITALHMALVANAGLITFHGPMLASDLLADKFEPTESALLRMLDGSLPAGSWLDHPLDHPLTTLLPGAASGPLVGGNLSMLCATLGTPYEVRTQQSILFLEEIEEELFRIDRLLTQLRLAGKFEGLRGVLVGDFTPRTLEELTPLLREMFGRLRIPVLAGWRSGHSNPNLTLPLGAQVTLDAGRQGLRIDQAVVTTVKA